MFDGLINIKESLVVQAVGRSPGPSYGLGPLFCLTWRGQLRFPQELVASPQECDKTAMRDERRGAGWGGRVDSPLSVGGITLKPATPETPLPTIVLWVSVKRRAPTGHMGF